MKVRVAAGFCCNQSRGHLGHACSRVFTPVWLPIQSFLDMTLLLQQELCTCMTCVYEYASVYFGILLKIFMTSGRWAMLIKSRKCTVSPEQAFVNSYFSLSPWIFLMDVKTDERSMFSTQACKKKWPTLSLTNSHLAKTKHTSFSWKDNCVHRHEQVYASNEWLPLKRATFTG